MSKGEIDLFDEHVRLFMLAKIFGWPPTVQDAQPAVELDWLLQLAAGGDDG